MLGPDQWQNKHVELQGTLLRFTDPDGSSYGVIQDSDQNRIGLKQMEQWTDLVGKQVDATGTVEFDPTFGWYLANPTLTQITTTESG